MWTPASGVCLALVFTMAIAARISKILAKNPVTDFLTCPRKKTFRMIYRDGDVDPLKINGKVTLQDIIPYVFCESAVNARIFPRISIFPLLVDKNHGKL